MRLQGWRRIGCARGSRPEHLLLVIANADAVMRCTNKERMAAVFPDAPLKCPVWTSQTLLSIETAGSVLGNETRHSWRKAAAG